MVNPHNSFSTFMMGEIKNRHRSLTLNVTSELASVPYVIQSLEKFCMDLDFDRDLIHSLLIATDEAITNIILHAYCGRTDGKIEVSFQLVRGDFIVQMMDYGKKFKPLRIRKKTRSGHLDRLRVGGYGLFLMDNLMDHIQFTYNNNEKANNLTMTKSLTPPRRSNKTL
ncbi:MAG: hypothetical protein IEMM0008_1603 [bacterium]|nr:MAG: hypothetical protein IEMM0008_1603 [bacterium]